MTIVLNTLTGAVSEYTGFGFESITPTHAGSATALCTLGGSLDVATPIVSSVVTGKSLWGEARKKAPGQVSLALIGSGTSTLTVSGQSVGYSYEFPVRAAGMSRAVPGKGIRENYLAFGYSNTDGADFRLDRIEVAVEPSQTRRV